jgi:glucose-6-phosphate isomerase
MNISWTKTLVDHPAYQKLKTLSKNPFDLTSLPDHSERIDQFMLEAEGWTYLYGTERIDPSVMDALYSLAKEAEALPKMQAMQAGEEINISEKRQVLHTAMRALSSSTKEANLAKGEIEKIKKFIKETEEFTDYVTVAIGGSDLGPRALFQSLAYLKKNGRNAHFISNVDPDDAAAVLKGLDLSKTLFAVVSKSGTTLETLTNETIVREALEDKGLDPKNHILAITQKGSQMDDLSRYRACFYLFDFVGGRYSATAAPGGLLLSFTLGIEPYLELLKGAEAMDNHARTAPPEENLPLTLALLGIWNRNFLDLPTVAVIPYSEALAKLPAHLQQLDMESNGKHVDRGGKKVSFQTGPILWGEPGTNAQHSFFQLIHQGTSPIPLEFIAFRRNQYQKDLDVQGTSSEEKLFANVLAQSIAFAVGEKNDNPNKECLGNRPSSLLVGDRLDPKTMGSLFALYEHKVAFQGFIWGINSFDQEGVQLGKRLAAGVLERMQGEGKPFPLADRLLEKAKWAP